MKQFGYFEAFFVHHDAIAFISVFYVQERVRLVEFLVRAHVNAHFNVPDFFAPVEPLNEN
jgi:hypothetical protein